MERVRPIVITDTETNQKYTLEFSRESVSFAEQRGFILDEIDKFPQTKVREFFYYAFRMHHKNLAKANTDKLIEKWWGEIGDIPEEVIFRLGELWVQTYTSYGTDEDNEGKKSKATIEM